MQAAAIDDAPTATGLTYTIQVSQDDGATWQTLAIGVETPEVTIERDHFERGQDLLVRFITTDGLTRTIGSPRRLEA